MNQAIRRCKREHSHPRETKDNATHRTDFSATPLHAPTAGTEIRKRYGLEAAQVILGHASADVTQVYAERDLQKAVEIIREVG